MLGGDWGLFSRDFFSFWVCKVAKRDLACDILGCFWNKIRQWESQISLLAPLIIRLCVFLGPKINYLFRCSRDLGYLEGNYGGEVARNFTRIRHRVHPKPGDSACCWRRHLARAGYKH